MARLEATFWRDVLCCSSERRSADMDGRVADKNDEPQPDGVASRASRKCRSVLDLAAGDAAFLTAELCALSVQ